VLGAGRVCAFEVGGGSAGNHCQCGTAEEGEGKGKERKLAVRYEIHGITSTTAIADILRLVVIEMQARLYGERGLHCAL
jgi:hypothetical protein